MGYVRFDIGRHLRYISCHYSIRNNLGFTIYFKGAAYDDFT